MSRRPRGRLVLVVIVSAAFLAGILADRAVLAASRSQPDIPATNSQGAVGEPDRAATGTPRAGAPTSLPRESPTATARRNPPQPTDDRHASASVSGLATWFCGPSSPCTAGHPASCRCAAAGPALRAWLGPAWRGQLVTVSRGDRSVTVRLIDWCACHGRVADLYATAFAELAPLARGVLRVEVRRG